MYNNSNIKMNNYFLFSLSNLKIFCKNLIHKHTNNDVFFSVIVPNIFSIVQYNVTDRPLHQCICDWDYPDCLGIQYICRGSETGNYVKISEYQNEQYKQCKHGQNTYDWYSTIKLLALKIQIKVQLQFKDWNFLSSSKKMCLHWFAIVVAIT